MAYIVINTQTHNGKNNDTSFFFAAPILSGQYIGKFATSENALAEFPKIFEQLEYELVDLDPAAFQVNTTPPALTPFACEIPLELQMPFRNGFFRLSGFEVPLETIQNKKVVNIAYLNWKEFRAELDRKYPDGTFVHQGIKDALMDLWDFVEAHAASIGPWMQDPQNNQLSEFIIIIQ